jgi:hypothetical protein
LLENTNKKQNRHRPNKASLHSNMNHSQKCTLGLVSKTRDYSSIGGNSHVSGLQNSVGGRWGWPCTKEDLGWPPPYVVQYLSCSRQGVSGLHGFPPMALRSCRYTSFSSAILPRLTQTASCFIILERSAFPCARLAVQQQRLRMCVAVLVKTMHGQPMRGELGQL